MNRLSLHSQAYAEKVTEELYQNIQRRVFAAPNLCPVEVASAFVHLCHSQSCGKCVPCRIGLGQLRTLLDEVLHGEGSDKTIDLIERTARNIKNSADCAIGFQAASEVLRCVVAFRSDFENHVANGYCLSEHQGIPCVEECPAEVDIPGYVALISDHRNSDALKVIRKDNPFPTACAYVCEHPCENKCRRNMLDRSINIRGLKEFAVENGGDALPMQPYPKTGKTIAIIGGGPSGLTAAFYLQLMGHDTTVFEKRQQLGGMLRYGIPSYRLNRENLQRDIDLILSTGVDIKTDTDINEPSNFKRLQRDFDAIYVAIGAHAEKHLNIPGEEGRGVFSAVEMLRAIGDGKMPDFKDKRVVVVGGGNVAMDVARTSVRLGAEIVHIAYRRWQEDMTALPAEVEGAIAEGCDVMELMAPVSIETDANEDVTGIWLQPQIIGPYDKNGRPAPRKADIPKVKVDADIVIVSIGQSIDSEVFAEVGLPEKWGRLVPNQETQFDEMPKVFSGGDCVTGPATVIKAIAAGKVAAANIDQHLGFDHQIQTDVEIPAPLLHDRVPCGRVELHERAAEERKHDFKDIELPNSEEEALQEASRCLRCDHFGYGAFRGGRKQSW